jgi:hypothetical protein
MKNNPSVEFAVETRDLWRIYPLRGAMDRSGENPETMDGIPALRGITLRVPAGKFVALKGRSEASLFLTGIFQRWMNVN